VDDWFRSWVSLGGLDDVVLGQPNGAMMLFNDMTLDEVLELLQELANEIEYQRHVDHLWTSKADMTDRLRLELRILHSILERDGHTEEFRELRRQRFLN
jgi:hypothetical protein